MKKENYPYITNENFARFEFESQGPNGTIKKVVDYFEIGEWIDGTPVYNLAFGDWDEHNNAISDSTISNNADRNKVLSTVANTVVDIMAHLGNIAVYAEGSTPARTRLYQMGINANRKEIEELFDIYGCDDAIWKKFESGKNYNAFLVTRKKRKFD
ncbi:DUF6934 family protein [Chitinophaga tropicalis]|uniref:Uncharacterized protein n=1 Tax=Chitinophaga tropicalis TaxID=2683588 RepID=A0A7K1UDL5_9BACT|nr:hypothetical protein [Chitinophaga tropicalis]MVT12105.1 hypothetical protein [Chitinophaga tropicalis]